jgi:hypothetical protein
MSPGSSPASSPSGSLTDEALQEALQRSVRTVIILGLVLFFVFTFTLGWQSGLLELAWAFISYTGIREWRSLARAVSATLGAQAAPSPMGRTLVMFFLRLLVVAAVLYASLKCLNGSVYALVAGIGLAVVALSFEALRLLRN